MRRLLVGTILYNGHSLRSRCLKMPFVDTPIEVTSTDQTKMYFQGLEERERKGYYKLIRG